MAIDGTWILGLFDRYHDELVALTPKVRERYWAMCERGNGAAFSDFEGEVLYCVLRELRPEVFFEISPDCGYSTLYAHEAIATNGVGKHYAFEIATEKRGKPTEAVIRQNALRPPDPERFELVFGDASQTVSAYPDPDVVLIDSCHDAWFAEWYWTSLLPRVRDVALVQDIVFHDRVEPSTEARWVLDALERDGVPFLALGVLERSESIAAARAGLTPRRPFETNSILISGTRMTVEALRPDFEHNEAADQLEAAYAHPPRKATGYRDLAGLSDMLSDNPPLAAHYWHRAVGYALEDVDRSGGKGLSELVIHAVRKRHILRALGVLAVAAVYCRPAIPKALNGVWSAFKGKTRAR